MKYLQTFLQLVTLVGVLFAFHILNDQRQQLAKLQANLRAIQYAEQLHSVIERYRATHDGELPRAENIWVQAGWERHWDRQLNHLIFSESPDHYHEPKAYSLKLQAWLPNDPQAGSVSYQPLPDGGYRIEAHGDHRYDVIFSRVYQ